MVPVRKLQTAGLYHGPASAMKGTGMTEDIQNKIGIARVIAINMLRN